MSAEKFANARVHERLTPTLDHVTEAMHTTRLQLNSAALWWFCHRLTPEERAEILGEYVKVQAMGGKEPSPTGSTHATTPGRASARDAGRPRRRKAAGDG
jgi:hypothetical protein